MLNYNVMNEMNTRVILINRILNLSKYDFQLLKNSKKKFYVIETELLRLYFIRETEFKNTYHTKCSIL